MIINHNIKKIRTLIGLTQKEFACKVGITLSTLKNYENTNVQPKMDAVLSICRFVGIDPEQMATAEINLAGINFCTPGGAQVQEIAMESAKCSDNSSNGTATAESNKMLELLKDNDEFFKHQYNAFNKQVLANLSLLITHSKTLEVLAKENLQRVQNIERMQSDMINR